MRQTYNQENSTLRWRTAEREMAAKKLARSETEDRTWEKQHDSGMQNRE
jgi:hypothetical protein